MLTSLRWMLRALWLSVVGLIVAAAPDERPERAQADKAAEPPRRFALLVGCTKYDHLSARWQLRGPANDVKLLGRLLQERFAFPRDNITVLSEASGQRPTRANIHKAFQRLAKLVAKGDYVVILLAGHGSQQPDQEPFDEIDGLDEVFLPCDAKVPAGPQGKAIENAIIDDELQHWTRAIVSKGANLWFIADSCHSGTLLRGDQEVTREVPADEIFSKVVLHKAAADAKARKIATATDGDLRWAAIYAAQPHEPTVESSQLDGAEGEYHGLLTHTLCRILTKAQAPLTYRELAKQIHDRYQEEGRSAPTPMVEGRDQDNEVLGLKTWPERSRWFLEIEGGKWRVNAGALHGVAIGDVFAGYPPVGAVDNDKVQGHVQVVETKLYESLVEPCAHGKMPEVRLKHGSRLERVVCNFGTNHLAVAVEPGAPGRSAPSTFEIKLHELAQDPKNLFQLARASAKADWVFAEQEPGRFFLMPFDLARLPGKPPPGAPRFGPFNTANVEEARDHLVRCARVRNLMKLTAAEHWLPRAGAETMDVDISMFQFGGATKDRWNKVAWHKDGLNFRDGDKIRWEIVNRGRDAVDITVLYVDSHQGIEVMFPHAKSVADNRLLAKETLTLPVSTVRNRTTGWEHVVVIAVRAEGAAVDFTFLAQPNLTQAAKAASLRGHVQRSLDSPLGRLCQQCFYGHGTTRAPDRAELENFAVRRFSWEVK